jgi:hypothetical protein
VQDLRDDLANEVTESANLAARGLAGLKLIPSVLGGSEKRTYLLLFADEGFQRGTAGEYFAYAQFTVDQGDMTLDRSGPIIEIDPTFRNVRNIKVPESNWYLRTFPASVRMGNLNWDPHYPTTASLARTIYHRKTKVWVDGVIQIDVTGVAQLLGGIGPIRVPSWPTPLTSGNLVKVALIDSYTEFDTGDQEETGDIRKQFHAELVEETWQHLEDPRDLVRTVFEMSKALAQRHLQIWSVHEEEQAFFQQQGWSGSIKRTPGDYLYVVEQNLGFDRLATFAFQRTNHDVTIREDGTLDVETTVRITNYPPLDLPKAIIGKQTMKTYVNVYAPQQATIESIVTRNRRATLDVKPLEHVQNGRKVFSGVLRVPGLDTGEITFRYTVPNGLVEVDGRPTYRLTLQRQPRPNTQSVSVTVRYPDGWDLRNPDDRWREDGNTATFTQRLPEDLSVDLTF